MSDTDNESLSFLGFLGTTIVILVIFAIAWWIFGFISSLIALLVKLVMYAFLLVVFAVAVSVAWKMFRGKQPA